jgi:sugar/nucleoside kinase (ribokinase family)
MDQCRNRLLSRFLPKGANLHGLRNRWIWKAHAIRPFWSNGINAELDALLGQTIRSPVNGLCVRCREYACPAYRRDRRGHAGRRGAVAATPEGEQIALAAPQVEVRSTVGAGDAMLGGMLAVYAGWRPDRASEQHGLLALALRTGVACGAAKAALTGTGMPARDAILDWYRTTSCPVTV